MKSTRKKTNPLAIITLIVFNVILIGLVVVFLVSRVIGDAMDTATKTSCCQANGGIWHNDRCISVSGEDVSTECK